MPSSALFMADSLPFFKLLVILCYSLSLGASDGARLEPLTLGWRGESSTTLPLPLAKHNISINISDVEVSYKPQTRGQCYKKFCP